MAKNAFNLTAQINLQGPSNLRTIVADIRRQVGTINVDINPNINPSAYRSITDLNRVFRDLNTTLAITETNARTTAAALQNLAQAVNNIGGRNLQQNINNAANAAQNLSRQANNAAQGVGAAATGMEQFGRQSALAVRRFAAFTTVTSVIFGLTTAIRSGVSAFIDFDKEFVRLKQVSDSGSAALGLLAKTITDLSVNLGVSSKELTTVSVTLAQAGLSIRDTEKALQALAKSALAPSFDNLNDTVEGSIALMRQFSISSDQLESALGSVNAVAAAFAVEASDLIAAIQRTGGVFATASKGVSEGTDALNEFLAIFTSVRQTTRESAETIATGLRTIFTRIQRGGTIEALKEYGIVLTDLEDKFVGPFEAVKRLSEGLSRLDPRDIRFSSIIEELGGFRQIGKVIPLIQQFAVAQQALKVAQKGSDSLAKDSATAQLSLANQIAKVREEFLALIRSIGQSESFRSFVSLALDLTSGLIKLADAAKIVLPALTALGAIRGLSALTQFGAGFAGSFAAAGGARGLGQRLGGGRRFASGGLVPGSGNQDSVDAKLTPGEFVLRKSAVQDIGVGNLRKINGGMIEKLAMGGLPKGRGLLGRRGARSRLKELTQEEISQLSTQDMIKYGKRLARDVFTTGGAGIATRSQFVEVPSSRVTPELAPYLQTYLGKSGFWQEKVSPFGRTSSRGGLQRIKQKQSRESALAAQKSRLTDEVAARAQEWTSIRQGSPIDNYLLGSLKEPSLSDYKTVRGGGSLSKIFHNTRLRQSVNKALDSFDDFDYSSGNIDRFVSAFAAKKFANGGLIQKFAVGTGVQGVKPQRSKTETTRRNQRANYLREVKRRSLEVGSSRFFGLVGLQTGLKGGKNIPTKFTEQNITPITKTPVKIQVSSLKKQYGDQLAADIEKTLFSGYKQAIKLSAEKLGSKAGLSISTNPKETNKIIKNTGFTNVVGSGLESALSLLGAEFVKKNEKAKSIDFPFGLGRTSELFGIQPNIPTDITRTIGGFGKPINQMLSQIERFLAAEKKGLFSRAQGAKTAQELKAFLQKNPNERENVNSLLQRFSKPGVLLPQFGPRLKVGKTLGKNLDTNPEGVAAIKQLISRKAFGGETKTALALLTPGEAVIDPSMAKSIGYSKLKKMNYADKYASGGGVGIVPGTGNGDTFGPVPLPVGSFVLRKKATKTLGLNRGGVVQKFAEGGNVETGAGFSFSSLFSNFGVLTGAVLGLSAGILALRNNFTAVSTNLQRFGQNLLGANRGLGSGGSATRRAYRDARASGLDRDAARAQVGGGRLGGFGSTLGFVALTAGGAAISSAGSMFDEKSKTGGVQNQALFTNALGDALNYGTIGATIGSTIGSVVPGFGTLIGGGTGAIVGGLAGLATGFISAAKATEEYEKAQMEAAAETVRNDQLKRAQENLAKEADKLNAALAKLLEVSINLSDKYNKASSYLDRFGVELQEVSRANAGLLSDLSGQGRISETSRLDEQVLKNISAYSTAEIAAVANKVGSLAGGGAEGKGLSDTIRAQKIIQEQLPTILRTTQSKDVSGVLNELKQLFKLELGPQLSGPVTSVLNEIDDALGETILKRTGEGSNLNQIADDIQKLVGPVAESAQKVASNLLNQYNNALNEAIRLQNEWIATTERANEINRKASTLRLEADLDLRRTLGQQISPAQENAPFEQNVRGLTASLIRGGTTDPALIGQRIDALRQENVQREKRVEKLQAGPQSNATARAIEAEQEAMRKNKVAINEGTKAIELLADNSAAAANALNRIQVKQQQAKSFVELVKNLYSASPEERLQTNRQLSAFQSGRAALATGRGREFFSNQQAGKDFFAGFEVLKDILGPQLAAQIEKAAVNALVQAGGIPLNTQFPSGVTAGETVALGTTGELRPDDPDKLAYDEAIERQRAALLEFERLMRESADLLQKQVKTIFGNLQDIFNALNRASADLKANIEALTAVRRNKGGLVYASGGALVDSVFKPRGKDTVPAMTTSGQPYMLEPGEMVINRRATNENYDLLKAINGGDNIDGMYARDGGIIGETRQKRREAYEQRKEEARARFRESKPGLARVLDARRKREEKESPELKKARDATYQRREKRKAFGAPGSLTQLEYERDRGQKLFGEFFGSTGDYKDKYYSELPYDEIFQDLRATAERPLGYSSLSLEDQNLADIAIDNFISNYESGRIKVIVDDSVRVDQDEVNKKIAADIDAEAREAVQAGIITPEAFEKARVNEFGYRSLSLTADERDKLRKKKLQKEFAEIDARSQKERETLANRRQGLAAQRAELDRTQSADRDAQNRINPYTGRLFDNRFQLEIAEDQAAKEGKTFAEIDEERKRKNKSAQEIAQKAKSDRLAREAYAQEQAEYEARMAVASKKATQDRRTENIRFQRQENEKGYLGYLGEGLYEATPTRAIGEVGYGLGEVVVGGFTGGVAGLSSLASVVGAVGARAAQYEGDLLQQGTLQPRTRLEDDQLSQGLLAATESNLRAAGAGFSTAGTGFERIGRALTFDKETMEAQQDSALATYETQRAQELSNQPLLQIPLGGDGRTNYSFRLPSQREIFGGANVVRDEALGAAIPTPAIPGVGRAIGRPISKTLGAIDDQVAKPIGKGLNQQGLGARAAEGAKRVRQKFNEVNTRMSQENAVRITEARTGSVRAKNPITGKIELIPDNFADNPAEYFRSRPAAEQRVFGKKFEYDTGPLPQRTEAVVAKAQDVKASNIFEELDVLESFSSEGLSPMQQSIMRANASTVKPIVTQPTSLPQPLTARESKMQQFINEAMALSDEQLGVTTEQVARQSRPNIIKPSLENIATREMLEKEALKRQMSGQTPTPLAGSSSARPVRSTDSVSAVAVATRPVVEAAPTRAAAARPKQAVAPTKPTPAAPATKPAPAVEAKTAPIVEATPAPVATPRVLSEADQIAKLDSEIATLRSQEKKGIFRKVSKQDEIERLLAQKRGIQDTIARRELMAKGAKNLEIERQGPGALFYQGEEWKRLVEGGIPNEYRVSGFRSEGIGGSKPDPDQLAAFGRLREAAADSRGLARTGSSGLDLGALGADQWDPTTKTFISSKSSFAPEFMTKSRQRPRNSTGYTIDEKGNIYISGEQYIGRTASGKIPNTTRDGLLYNIPADAVTPELLENIAKLNIPQFKFGGMVRGRKGDNNIIKAADGEYIMNQAATSNNLSTLKYMNKGGIVKPTYMETGGSAGSTSSTSSSSSASSFGGSYTLSLEDKSITFMQTFSDQLNTFGKDFNSYVTQLSQIKIPDKIEMVGRHSVEVNVNGAAAFEAIEEGVKSLINTEIGKKMNMLWNQSGGQLGESIPTGDFNTGASRTQV